MVQVNRGDCRWWWPPLGNAGCGLGGGRLGLDIITVVPEGAPASKIERGRYGAG